MPTIEIELEKQYSKNEIFNEIDSIKAQIDSARPLPVDIEGRVMQKLRLDWNYNSNAIEGNQLDYGETVAFLMTGITAKGKPLKDHLDIRGHNEAINFLLAIVKDARPITESDVRALHEMILVESYEVSAQTSDGTPTKKLIKLGEYKQLPNHVKTVTGEINYYATPEETPIKMHELFDWYRAVSKENQIHPVVVAALFHHKFVEIHPFDDGNGRLSRILMNLILMKNGYPPVVIKTNDRQNYYALLNQADAGNTWPFIEYISDRLINSLQLFVKALAGGDINEDEDIDKEITLLRMQLKGGVVAKEKKSQEAMRRVFTNNILGLAISFLEKSRNFDEFFFKNNKTINFTWNEKRIEHTNAAGISDNLIQDYQDFIRPDLEYIKFIFDFIEYKDPDNGFSIRIESKIIFDEFRYKVFNNKNEELISKFYHEDLFAFDKSKALKSFIDDFKNQVNEKLKSPKP